MAKFLADQIPSELDAVENARLSNSPLLMVRSERDRVIPAEYQRLIWNGYAGCKTEFVIRGADHHHGIDEPQRDDYVRTLNLMLGKWFET